MSQMDKAIDILWIDDELFPPGADAIKSRVTKLLEFHNGFSLRTACTAAEGVQRLQEKVADVLIMDIIMAFGRDFPVEATADPMVAGIHLIQYVRDTMKLSMPIIVITNRPGALSEGKREELGVVSFMPKPMRIEKLAEIIKSVLEET